MKIKPVILCGGEGTRLWPKSKINQPKQFINFGGWTLFEKTLERIKGKMFDCPVISTNFNYLKQVRYFLKKNKIKKYSILLEPEKKNTAPAILASTLIKEIKDKQPIVFFPADHLFESSEFIKAIRKNKKYLNKKNIFIFGIKPTAPSKEYGYFITKKVGMNINKVTKVIEKPSESRAQKIIQRKGYWNSGIFFARKDSIINNFKKYQPKIYKNCIQSVRKSKFKKKTYWLKKSSFASITSKSFDYGILEKTKNINGIMLNISWTDLGNWREILKVY